MQCYYCGNKIPSSARLCPACGRAKTKRVYVPLWGVIGGVVGSLIGFTAFNMEGALVGGLLGILLLELAGRMVFRPK
jgi:hypothetical protein